MWMNHTILTSAHLTYRRYIFYIGGWINDVSQPSLFFMDIISKLRWILQIGKINPPGLSGQVLSNYVLEESILETNNVFSLSTSN